MGRTQAKECAEHPILMLEQKCMNVNLKKKKSCYVAFKSFNAFPCGLLVQSGRLEYELKSSVAFTANSCNK